MVSSILLGKRKCDGMGVTVSSNILDAGRVIICIKMLKGQHIESIADSFDMRITTDGIQCNFVGCKLRLITEALPGVYTDIIILGEAT